MRVRVGAVVAFYCARGVVRVSRAWLDQGSDERKLIPKRKWGTPPAVRTVEGHLRTDHVGENLAAVPDNGSGGFITRSLDAEDFHSWANRQQPAVDPIPSNL